jgi:hypothetical protein
MHIFADGFSKVSLSNNNLRITLSQNGPDSTPIEAGTLIIPANMAAGFVNGMLNSLKQLEEQIKARSEAQAASGENKMDVQ